MGKENSQPKVPKAPNSTKSYGQGVNDYFQYLPQFLQAEQDTRTNLDPQRIQSQQDLQDKFGPHQYQQMIDAFKQIDPKYFDNRNQFADTLSKNLGGDNNPYSGMSSPNFDYFKDANPNVGNAFSGMSGNVGNAFSGMNGNVGNAFSGINSNVGNAYSGMNANVGNAYSGINPNAGNQFKGISTDLQAKLTPDQQREVEQQARQSQVARGNSAGSAAAISEAYAKGTRGLQLGQQNLQNQWTQAGNMQGVNQQNLSNTIGLAGLNQGVNQQGFENRMGLAGANQGVNQQGFANQMGLAGANQGVNQQNFSNQFGLANANQGVNQQGFSNAFGLANANQGVNQQGFANQMGLGQANLGQGQSNFQNQMGLIGAKTGYDQQQIANMGNFLGQPTFAQQAGFIPPVSPDRSSAYVNPNAGFQGQQFQLQNFQNQLGASQLGQNQSGNPWMSALGSVASIAGPILAASLSDRRAKTDIKKVGTDDKGLNLYSFAYKGPKHVGYMADEVKERFPEHVAKDPASGYYMVSQRFAPVPVGG